MNKFNVGDIIEWRISDTFKQTGIVEGSDNKGVLIYWFEIGRLALAPTPIDKAIKDYTIISRVDDE